MQISDRSSYWQTTIIVPADFPGAEASNLAPFHRAILPLLLATERDMPFELRESPPDRFAVLVYAVRGVEPLIGDTSPSVWRLPTRFPWRLYAGKRVEVEWSVALRTRQHAA